MTTDTPWLAFFLAFGLTAYATTVLFAWLWLRERKRADDAKEDRDVERAAHDYWRDAYGRQSAALEKWMTAHALMRKAYDDLHAAYTVAVGRRGGAKGAFGEVDWKQRCREIG